MEGLRQQHEQLARQQYELEHQMSQPTQTPSPQEVDGDRSSTVTISTHSSGENGSSSAGRNASVEQEDCGETRQQREDNESRSESQFHSQSDSLASNVHTAKSNAFHNASHSNNQSASHSSSNMSSSSADEQVDLVRRMASVHGCHLLALALRRWLHRRASVAFTAWRLRVEVWRQLDGQQQWQQGQRAQRGQSVYKSAVGRQPLGEIGGKAAPLQAHQHENLQHQQLSLKQAPPQRLMRHEQSLSETRWHPGTHSVEISSVRVVEEGYEVYAIYRVVYEDQHGMKHPPVERRYSEFDAMARKMQCELPETAIYGMMPPKTWFLCNKFESRFLCRRRIALRLFLIALLEQMAEYTTVEATPVVARFFGLETHRNDAPASAIPKSCGFAARQSMTDIYSRAGMSA